MNWFPTFLSPLTGLIDAAIAAPTLLLLYFLKLRRRELAVSSTLLWKKAIQDMQVNAPFQKLRRNLLLILQMLLLLALCLALTRPITFFQAGAGKSTVILIDRSASMSAADIDNGRSTRLDEAKREAIDLVNTMQRGSTAMLIAFDDHAETVQSFTGDTAALKTSIEKIKPTDRKTRMRDAYQLADANMSFNSEQLRSSMTPPDVVVFSDGRTLDGADLSSISKPTLHRIGSDSAGNVAIVALSAKRNYEQPNQVQIFARLVNYGPAPVSGEVELSVAVTDPKDPSVDGSFKVRGLASVSLPPARWSDEAWLATGDNRKERDESYATRDSVDFTLDLSTAATIKVEHKLKDHDVLPADDVAYVTIPPPKSLSVLFVTDGNYYISLLQHSLHLRDSKVMSPAEYESALPTSFDVIIFDRAYSPPKLPPTGNFIYFGGLPSGLKLKVDQIDGKNIVLDQVGVIDWNREHPILRGLALGKLYVGEAMKLMPTAESQTLIEGTKGPLLVLDREGNSTHLVFAFDLLQTYNFATKPVFPALMYQALQYLAVGANLGATQSFDPGSTPRIPRTNLAQIGEPRSITLNGPRLSQTLSVPATGDVALPALDRVGVYETSPVIPGFERIAVNLLDESESNLMPVDHPPGSVGNTIVGKPSRSRLNLWWWLVAAVALPLLLIEWWVYTRRVHM